MSTSTGTVTGVDFVMISASDIDRARHFYGEVLGLEVSTQWGEMPAFEFETGRLSLAVADVSAFGQEHSVNRQPIALQVGDAHAARQALEAQGTEGPVALVRTRRPPPAPPGCRRSRSPGGCDEQSAIRPGFW